MARRSTHEEYVYKVESINKNIEVLGQYINARTKILHKCKKCMYEFYSKPNSILSGYGCPRCGGTMRLTNKEYEERVANVNPNIEVVGHYVNMHVKILHKCKTCKYEWLVKPNDVINRHNGCPMCDGRKVGNAPEYRNSIWASQYKNYFSQFMTEEQMKKYTPKSCQKIYVSCPDCNRRKISTPNTLLRNGIGCICGDGVSYPNKFVYSILKQLDVDIILEYSPEWANRKKYDVYIPEFNCIVENHGEQHYDESRMMFNNTYNYIKQIDDYKEIMAKENGIENYVVIDCRRSNAEWIKKSILNSDLVNILNFSEYDIDWVECDKFATSNLVKVVSDLWNDGLCANQIIETTKLSRNTIFNYLIKGSKLSMCDYTAELSHKRTRKYNNNLKRVTI